MHYIFLGLAIVLEVIGSSFMKVSEGFSKALPTIITILAYLSSFFCLSQALKSISLAVVYTLWAGLGIVLTAFVSAYIFKQKFDLASIIGIGLIVLGVIVINFFSKGSLH